eukprot:317652-Ditylum_brightwellii.AAC.1
MTWVVHLFMKTRGCEAISRLQKCSIKNNQLKNKGNQSMTDSNLSKLLACNPYNEGEKQKIDTDERLGRILMAFI